MADKHAQELSPQDYINKIKDSYQITSKVETKFFSNEEGKDATLTVEDLIKKKKNVFYWRGCKDSKYKVAANVTLAKVMIENCQNCTITLTGPITTNVVEVWRCDNLTINIDTDVFTLQADLCNNLKIEYTHKKHLGSVVQAGVKGMRVCFLDYPELDFDSGFHVLQKDHPDINDTIDQFITRFLDDKLTTEQVVRDKKGFHTTDREIAEQKDQPEERTTEQLKEMLKMAGPTVGLEEAELLAKSKEGRAELEKKLNEEKVANLKKQAGNKAFTKGDYPMALRNFTSALEISPDNHLLYSNRCATYIQMQKWEEALKDADKCIELASDFTKGHFRRGVVLLEMNRKEEALKALTTAHDLDPKDEEIIQALTKAKSN